MPLESEYPVHVNGHFLVDDSRKHLESTPDLGLDNWNKSLIESVIAPCYVDLLLKAQQMTEECVTHHKWFYSLFPQSNVKGEVGDLKLAEAVYKQLFSINPKVLLQIQQSSKCAQIVKRWFHLTGKEMGYFFHSFTSEDTKQWLSADCKLREALITLGMPITTEAPSRMYKCLSEVEPAYLKRARVDPHKIVDHLKQLTPSTLQAALTDRTVLQLLLVLH